MFEVSQGDGHSPFILWRDGRSRQTDYLYAVATTQAPWFSQKLGDGSTGVAALPSEHPI